MRWPMGPTPQAQLNTAADFFVGNMKNPYGALPDVVERVTKVWVDKGTALASLAEGADLLVTGMNEQRLAANIAEHEGIPLVALHSFPSRFQPSGQLNSWLVKASEQPLRRALGLPEAPEPPPASMEIQAYDERCLPGQPDEWAEPGKPFVGALTLESPTDTDDAVLSWIAEGTAPVYFGMGSTPISPTRRDCRHDDRSVRAIERAVVDLHRAQRLVRIRSLRPRQVRRRGRVTPRSFLGCQAAVHHGGAGTTAAAMRAGVPSLILWLWLDQPVWAAGAEQLKIGTGQRFSDANLESLTAGLRWIVIPEYLDRAGKIAAEMISPYESASSAADFVEAAASTD